LDCDQALVASGKGDSVRVIGVDGCRGGWVCVALSSAGDAAPEWWVSAGFADVVERATAHDRVLVDIPIGLLDRGPDPREPDALARRMLGGKRASSVFSAPVRPVLGAPDYPAANELSRALTGKGLSKQSWMIAPKIREVDDLLRARPGWIGRVREVHPELCFHAFAGGRSMRHNKKTDEGFRERLALLVERYAEAERVLGSILLHAGKRVARDDAVDAFAAALTGLGPGPLRTIPETPARDAAGIPMEMVFAG
jgi:predicted RNase H-like nuclease